MMSVQNRWLVLMMGLSMSCSEAVQTVDLSDGRMLHELNETEVLTLCDELHNGLLGGEWLNGGVQQCDSSPRGSVVILGHSGCAAGLMSSEPACGYSVGEWRQCWQAIVDAGVCPNPEHDAFCLGLSPQCFGER